MIASRTAERPTASASASWRSDGVVSFQAGDMAAAIAKFQQAAQLDPKQSAAQGALADVYLSQGKFAEAAAAAHRPLGVTSRPAGAYYPAYLDFVRRTLRRDYHEADLTEAGLRMLPWTGMPMIVAPIAGLLSDRIGGRPVVAASRGGASDASHFASTIPVTIDGLGPRGGKAHNPEEFVLEASLLPRVEVALAVVDAVLAGG